ncbi:MAG: Flp family type IVb pilin, partial [Candidatus Nanopelagicales bacterium]
MKVRDIARREEGATAVEYGLIIGLIAVVIIVAVTLLGDTLAGLFNTVTNE